MLIAMHGVKLYAHFYTSREALCSLLYIEVNRYAHCYSWIEALCSMLYKE